MSAHVDPAALETATGAARTEMLAHLRGCAACRRAVVDQDPSALFALLALAPVPERVLDEVQATVVRRAGDAAPSYGVPAPWLRRAAAAAIFALVVLSGYVTLHDRTGGPAPAPVLSQRADVEVDTGRGVSQVIDLTVGETQLVMVYNGDLKL